jgi:hypothetical protein
MHCGEPVEWRISRERDLGTNLILVIYDARCVVYCDGYQSDGKAVWRKPRFIVDG